MSEALRKLKELVARKQLAEQISRQAVVLNVPPEGMEPEQVAAPVYQPEGRDHQAITLNERQGMFVDLVTAGSSCALIGPAGTGKTTSTRQAVLSLIQSGRVPQLQITGHKWLTSGTPGVVCISFTNKAVQNLKKVMPADLQRNCMTIHKLLEYQPEYLEVYDPVQGKYKNTMQFVPSWNESRKLPSSLQTIIIDEASMVPTSLWNRLFEALPLSEKLQIILIGDIQQLPPVFGKSIFIHALKLGIPRVELVEVYRQALESPIISLAHKILRGEITPAPKLDELTQDKMAEGNGKVTIQPWKKALSADAALVVLGRVLPAMIDSGAYTPKEDAILCPFNKALGTIELNKIIANHLAKAYNPEKEPVYEVVAGMNKKYFRVGDKVLWNKTEHFITKIERNTKYFGKPYKPASLTLDYWGIEQDANANSMLADVLLGESFAAEHAQTIDDLLSSMAIGTEEDKSDIVRAASHTITIWSDEFDCEETLDTAGEISLLDLGYALTVHKSQGSEYRRVLFITHSSHSNMLFRELVYTAVTRAKEELHVICPPSLFVAGVTSQRLPGKTLEDKIVAFDRYTQLNAGKTAEDEIPKGTYLFQPQKIQ